MFDITSANSTITLACDELGIGVNLEQFAADTAYSADNQQVSETRIGIDGTMVAGMVPSIKPVTIQLEASSPSTQYLTLIKQAMEANRTVYEVQMVISQPAIGKRITYSRGVLHDCSDLSEGARVLGPTTWVFHFNDKSDEQM